MDNSNNIISSNMELKTLEFLMNPSQYDKLMKKHITDVSCNDEDIDFYHDRILHATNEMLSGSFESSSLKEPFIEYTKNMIGFFKFQDTYDIMQEEYTNIIVDENIVLEKKDKIDKMKYKNRKCITLDKFVQRVKKKKNKKQLTLPLQKNINLKDPNLKKKGLKKKKKKNIKKYKW